MRVVEHEAVPTGAFRMPGCGRADLAYLKLVGKLARLGRRATEEEVRAWFAPYGEFAGLAGTHLAHAAASGAFRAP
ncbi:MAG: hypothetical protein ACR2FZ_04505 [Thermoleophilaceae bacterium]